MTQVLLLLRNGSPARAPFSCRPDTYPHPSWLLETHLPAGLWHAAPGTAACPCRQRTRDTNCGHGQEPGFPDNWVTRSQKSLGPCFAHQWRNLQGHKVTVPPWTPRAWPGSGRAQSPLCPRMSQQSCHDCTSNSRPRAVTRAFLTGQHQDVAGGGLRVNASASGRHRGMLTHLHPGRAGPEPVGLPRPRPGTLQGGRRPPEGITDTAARSQPHGAQSLPRPSPGPTACEPSVSPHALLHTGGVKGGGGVTPHPPLPPSFET